MASVPDIDTRVRLVHFSAHQSSWMLDAIVDEPCGFGDAGLPLAIEVEKPENEWFEATIEAMLERWARDDRMVAVHVAGDAPHLHVRLQADETTFQTHLVRVR